MTSSRRVTVSGARELTAVINQLRRALRRSVRSDERWRSRPMAQIEVLQVLRESPDVRAGDLAAQLDLAPSTASGLIAALVAQRLVRRHAEPGDRRVQLISMTAAGAAELHEWDTAHRVRLATALRTLDDADRAAVLEAVPALRRLVAALRTNGEG